MVKKTTKTPGLHLGFTRCCTYIFAVVLGGCGRVGCGRHPLRGHGGRWPGAGSGGSSYRCGRGYSAAPRGAPHCATSGRPASIHTTSGRGTTGRHSSAPGVENRVDRVLRNVISVLFSFFFFFKGDALVTELKISPVLLRWLKWELSCSETWLKRLWFRLTRDLLWSTSPLHTYSIFLLLTLGKKR